MGSKAAQMAEVSRKSAFQIMGLIGILPRGTENSTAPWLGHGACILPLCAEGPPLPLTGAGILYGPPDSQASVTKL